MDIQNRLKIIGDTEDLAKLLNYIKSYVLGEELQIDFNKIIPIPESINIESDGLGELAHELLFGGIDTECYQNTYEGLLECFNDTYNRHESFAALDIDLQKEGIDLALKYQKNIDKYDYAYLADWTIGNWETNKNAYGQNDVRNTANTIYFLTANCPPINLILELSRLFPAVQLQLLYTNVDTPWITGRISLTNGKFISRLELVYKSMDAFDIYFEMYPDKRKDYKLINGKYEFINEFKDGESISDLS